LTLNRWIQLSSLLAFCSPNLVARFLFSQAMTGRSAFCFTDSTFLFSVSMLFYYTTVLLSRRRPFQIVLSVHGTTILWTAWAISMKLTGNIHLPLLMTRRDSGGQRSRSHRAVKVAKASTSTLVEVQLPVPHDIILNSFADLKRCEK